jgi:hypothetical protein
MRESVDLDQVVDSVGSHDKKIGKQAGVHTSMEPGREVVISCILFWSLCQFMCVHTVGPISVVLCMG